MATKKKTSKKTAARVSTKTAARAPKKSIGKRPAPARRAKGASGALDMRGAAPSFTVNDVDASLAFYRDALGFQVKKRWEEKGKLLGVELAAGKVMFMLGQDDWKKGRNRDKGQGVRIYCTTDQDVDRIAARIKAAGVALTDEPRDEEWGMRAFSFEDPDGYKLTIAAKLKR